MVQQHHLFSLKLSRGFVSRQIGDHLGNVAGIPLDFDSQLFEVPTFQFWIQCEVC
eukprot:m.235250 g.235250  ORF g.235250 m.235250 type:complete len:55 (-) comp15760_c0_seq2:5514-5678(-)